MCERGRREGEMKCVAEFPILSTANASVAVRDRK